jgi:hypothetical protein
MQMWELFHLERVLLGCFTVEFDAQARTERR